MLNLPEFSWKNKTHYVRKLQLTKEYDTGCLEIIDYEAMKGMLKLKWFKTVYHLTCCGSTFPKASFKKLKIWISFKIVTLLLQNYL